MIVEISDQPSEDVPLITGLDVEKQNYMKNFR